MGRPDFERLRRNAAVIFSGAGEAATLRTFASATNGAAKFGAGPVPSYSETTITGLFAATRASEGTPIPMERSEAGGQVQAASIMVTTDRALGARDQIVWRGSAYRVAGESTPEHIGGRIMWRSPLVLVG